MKTSVTITTWRRMQQCRTNGKNSSRNGPPSHFASARPSGARKASQPESKMLAPDEEASTKSAVFTASVWKLSQYSMDGSPGDSGRSGD
ncbi:hypothetical protein DL769_002249 [Monosporascus sp. CRB-8-3]|nr:hypothetical protein DL769_002249 [Monosporascus sp. CRB-8-3]